MSIHEVKTSDKRGPAGPRVMQSIPVRGAGQDLSGGHQGVHFTVLTDTAAGGPSNIVQLLGRDYARLEVKILAVDQPIVIAQSKEMAESAANALQSATTGQTSSAQPSPAAGSNFVYTNNTGAAQQIVAATAVFTADAVADNRFLSYAIKDAAGNTIAADADGTAVIASDVVNLRLYQGAAQINSASGNVTLPLPSGLYIPAGGEFLLNGVVDSGDAWSSIVLAFAAQAAATVAPVGAYLPAGIERTLRNCDELWAAATSPLTSRISVSVSRRLQADPDQAPS
jgi:hypothetical protein